MAQSLNLANLVADLGRLPNQATVKQIQSTLSSKTFRQLIENELELDTNDQDKLILVCGFIVNHKSAYSDAAIEDAELLLEDYTDAGDVAADIIHELFAPSDTEDSAQQAHYLEIFVPKATSPDSAPA